MLAIDVEDRRSLGELSASQLVHELLDQTGRIEKSDGGLCVVYQADLQPQELVRAVSTPWSGLQLFPNTEGELVDTVKEESGGNIRDGSKQAGPLGWHTDGLSLHPVPELVLLHCVQPGNDAPTVFADTTQIYHELVAMGQDPEVMAEIDQVYEGKQGRVRTTVVDSHPSTGEPVMNVGRNVRYVPRHGSKISEHQIDEFVGTFGQVLENVPRTRLTWRRGNAVAFDNVRLAHAREEASQPGISGPPRELIRTRISRRPGR